MDSSLGYQEDINADFYVRSDCEFFTGARPCKFWRPCMSCDKYNQVSYRILVVMLIKLGDMLILSPLIKAMKDKWPNSHITWLADESAIPVIKLNPYVSRILKYSWESVAQLRVEKFDLVLGYEREPAAAALVHEVFAHRKVGEAYGGVHNALYALNPPAEHYFKMNTWNDFRVNSNRKTWTEFYFEMVGFQYNKEPYVLELSVEVMRRCLNEFNSLERNRKLICLNIGGSLSTKIWPVLAWVELGKRLLDRGHNITVIGGRSDTDCYEALTSTLTPRYGAERLALPGWNRDIEEVCGFIKLADLVVTGDTFGFHVALAFDIPLVALFGPSSPHEVVPKHKTNVKIIQSPAQCSPCADQVSCNWKGGCMEAIGVENVERNIADVFA